MKLMKNDRDRDRRSQSYDRDRRSFFKFDQDRDRDRDRNLRDRDFRDRGYALHNSEYNSCIMFTHLIRLMLIFDFILITNHNFIY